MTKAARFAGFRFGSDDDMNEAEATIEILSEIIVKLRREKAQLQQRAEQLQQAVTDLTEKLP